MGVHFAESSDFLEEMLSLPTVEVISGTESLIGEGKSGALRCLVRYADNSTRAAVVKRLPPANVAAEAFCALLLRGWGLNVPEPALVTGPPVAFACIEMSYPNLKQKIGWSDSYPDTYKELMIQFGSKLVASFSQTPLALAADEAIENRDRHLGNILWDGNEAAWIDHDQALRVWTFPLDDRNKLADIAVLSGDHLKVQRSAIALSFTLGQQAIDDAMIHCSHVAEAPQFASQVAGRLAHLAGVVLAQFPQPRDLLTQEGAHAS